MEHVLAIQFLPLTDRQEPFELLWRQRTEGLIVQKLLVLGERNGPTLFRDGQQLQPQDVLHSVGAHEDQVRQAKGPVQSLRQVSK